MADEEVRTDTEEQVSEVDAGLSEAERLRSWYEAAAKKPASEEETIGLLGVRRRGDNAEGYTRRSRYKRVWEMASIIRKYDILHGLTPVTLRNMLEELGPTFVKAGQILSMRSEILPNAFCQELAKLRTEAEPMPLEVVIETLRSEYDVPLEEIFESIDDAPLGSASVAQVHKARLVTGETVAIKVQRPGVRSVMAQDINIMRTLARHASRVIRGEQIMDIQSVVEELWQSFREETDFLVEAHSLSEFRRDQAGCAFVTCPKPYSGLCTEHVVVMDYVEGIPISDLGALVEASYDLSEIGEKLVENYATQVLDKGFFHADPHPGNIIISDGKIVYIDLGFMGRLSIHDRKAIGDIVFAVADMDTPRLMNGLLRFAVSTDAANLNHAHLLADLDDIVRDYGTEALTDLDVAQLLNAIVTLARRRGIELPSSITMLARSLVTLEGTVEHLLIDESIIDVIANHISLNTDIIEQGKNELSRYGRELRTGSHGLLKALAQAPLAMDMLTRGQLRVNLDVPGSDDPLLDLSHTFDRLTMGVVIAGLFIGSSVIYFAGMKPLVFGIPIIGLLGFLVAFVLGVWLITDIMREGKRRKR